MDRLKLAIIQPSYIPWKGYFEIIKDSDIFVFLDNVQYTVRDWRNKNFIKGPNGLIPLIVPVKGGRDQLIRDARIDNFWHWQYKHRESLIHSYSHAPYFKKYFFLVEEIYVNNKWEHLSELDTFIIKELAQILDLNTEFHYASDIGIDDRKTQLIMSMCDHFNSEIYISGPRAQAYVEKDLLDKTGIEIIYKDYANYRKYPQLFGPFVHGVSILDTLFNCGEDTLRYILSSD